MQSDDTDQKEICRSQREYWDHYYVGLPPRMGSRKGIWLYKETKHGVGEKEGEKLVYFNVTVRKFM